MSILSWIIFGLITGVIVSMFDPKSSEDSVVSGMILGVVGALFGGLLANLLLHSSINSFHPVPLLFAAIAALLSLSAGRFFKRL